MFERNRWRIFPGDEVCVIDGPLKGSTGKVLDVIKDKRVPQVIINGVNMRKKKIPTGKDEDDFMVITMEAPVHYSQVALMVPEDRIKQAVSAGVFPEKSKLLKFVEDPSSAKSEGKDESASKPNPLTTPLSPLMRAVRAKFSYTGDGKKVRVGVSGITKHIWLEGVDVTLDGGRKAVLLPLPADAADSKADSGDVMAGAKDTSEEAAKAASKDDFKAWLDSSMLLASVQGSRGSARSSDDSTHREAASASISTSTAGSSGPGQTPSRSLSSEASRTAGSSSQPGSTTSQGQTRSMTTLGTVGDKPGDEVFLACAHAKFIRQHGGFALRGWRG